MFQVWNDGHLGESKKLRVWRIFRPEMGRYVTQGQFMEGEWLSVNLLVIPGVTIDINDGKMRRGLFCSMKRAILAIWGSRKFSFLFLEVSGLL